MSSYVQDNSYQVLITTTMRGTDGCSVATSVVGFSGPTYASEAVKRINAGAPNIVGNYYTLSRFAERLN